MENLQARAVEKMMSIGYKENLAQEMSVELLAATPVKKAFSHWVETGEETDCVYEEFSAFRLMSERRHKYPAALNAIDWLNRDPQKARKALTSGVCRLIRRKE